MEPVALEVRLKPEVVAVLDRVSANQRAMNRLLAENGRLLEQVVKGGFQVVKDQLEFGKAVAAESDATVPAG